jgi:hypothetical protein
MIEKKDCDLSNPNNWRPISLTNSIVKIAERMIQARLVGFLDKYDIINKYQSGFRNHRSTTDNLLFFTQKALEAFDDNKKVCGVVFDIRKAFDKVWHAGLLFKMNKMNIPKKIGSWIKSFLSNRKFRVKIDDSISNVFQMTTSVPQGSCLSPVLFDIQMKRLQVFSSLMIYLVSILIN